MLRYTGKTTFTRDVNIKLQDQTAGSIKVEYNHKSQDQIDEWLDTETSNSIVFDEIVKSVSGIAKEDDNGKFIECTNEEQLEIAKQDPAIVAQVVAFFFKITRPAERGEKTSKRRR